MYISVLSFVGIIYRSLDLFLSRHCPGDIKAAFVVPSSLTTSSTSHSLGGHHDYRILFVVKRLVQHYFPVVEVVEWDLATRTWVSPHGVDTEGHTEVYAGDTKILTENNWTLPYDAQIGGHFVYDDNTGHLLAIGGWHRRSPVKAQKKNSYQTGTPIYSLNVMDKNSKWMLLSHATLPFPNTGNLVTCTI
jgi:hypothetical protein